MKKYEWILFDVDDTLFSWDAFQGIKHTLAPHGLDFTEQDFQEYQIINKALWTEYQNGNIGVLEIQQQRFLKYANQLNISAVDIDNAFSHSMASLCQPLEGATTLLNLLKGKVKLGIITNGFKDLLEVRLERHGWSDHFDIKVISEILGFAKPQKGIFDHAFSLMGNPARDKILMIGDNFDSDILGGINAGIDTCWLNPHNKIATENLIPNYQVTSLLELEDLFKQHHG